MLRDSRFALHLMVKERWHSAVAIVAPPVWRTIVGVSPAIRHSSPQDAEPPAVVYVPLRQDPSSDIALLVRSPLEPGSVSAARSA